MNDAIKDLLGMKPAVDKSNSSAEMWTFNVGVYVLPFWPKGEATASELDQKYKAPRLVISIQN